MTFDEALQEIGAAPGSSLDEIRRAYLRKTRTWNPATDPDGLRRLREAYELLQAELSQAPPATPPEAPVQPTAEPLPEAPDPQERRAPWIVIEPVAEKPVAFQWFTLIAGGLFLATALWFWSSGRPDPISTDPPPSATSAVKKMCTPWPSERDMKWICRESKLLLDQVAKGECADARRSLSNLQESWARRQGPLRDAVVQSLLEREVAGCRNLWDPWAR